jgi:thiamine-monophosphate kinase
MSAPEGWDEFDLIDRLFRPLAEGAPEALDLRDDAAVIPSRAGHDLIVTTDSIVEGVHFLNTDPPDMVARKLLRVNLSDLAAKGAKPYGYLLNICWPHGHSPIAQELFAAGLAKDQRTFGIKLFGGDTTSTSGPLTLGATMLGWVPSGRMVRRSGARQGDLLLVSGTIGDATLGLEAAQGGVPGFAAWQNELLTHRYRLPTPRLDLLSALAGAHAAADVSDGVIADAGHIAEASGLGLEIDLERAPLSPLAAEWVARQPDATVALSRLVTGGDDYEIVCAAPEPVAHFTAVGRFVPGSGVRVRHGGHELALGRKGFRHGKDG